MKKLFASVAACLIAAAFAGAQDFRSDILDDACRAGAEYYTYHPGTAPYTPAPAGYKPFYISHYGRHGSRYLTRQGQMQGPYDALVAAEAKGILTEEGKALFEELKVLKKEMDGMYGMLSAKGAAEHRGIAERMARNFPRVFRGRHQVDIICSIYPRCLLSMSNSVTALLENTRGVQVSYLTGDKIHQIINRQGESYQGSREELLAAKCHTEGLVSRLFTNPKAAEGIVGDPIDFAYRLFRVASISQTTDTAPDLLKYFSNAELAEQAAVRGDAFFLNNCNSEEMGAANLERGRLLVADVVNKADRALLGDSPVAADLRYGHDTGLAPLLLALGIKGLDESYPYLQAEDNINIWEYFCMACNVQLVFYRSRRGDVLVKVLLNETEREIPALEPVSGPYYRWTDLRRHLLEPYFPKVEVSAEDAAAFASADWAVTEGPNGMETRSATISLFGGYQTVSIVSYPSGAYDTDLVVAEGEAAGTVSTLSSAVGAAAGLNASYFNVETLENDTFVRSGGKVLGITPDYEFVRRTNGMLSISADGRHFDITTTPSWDVNSNVRMARGWEHSISSGPVLIEDGEIQPCMFTDTRTLRRFYDKRHPRTLFGYDGVSGKNGDPGRVYMIVIDGRFPGQADGATIPECAAICSMLGLTNAINLDGGGSSTIWTDAEGVINHPYDNKVFDHEGERVVPNIIVAK